MNKETQTIHPWIHRFAILTAVIAMFPIVLGALTTTKDAGMAFPDWPTSDGQGMFSYPWLKLLDDINTSIDSEHKFFEHGHRLAGILVGIAGILLLIASWVPPTTKLLKTLGLCVFLAICGQGLLGGYRVELNERGLAMFHGFFAALVFALICVMATIASKTWKTWEPDENSRSAKGAKISSLVYLIFLLVQYLLGGLIRHPIDGVRAPVHEHLGFGVLALIGVHAVLFFVIKSKIAWLRSAMRLVIILTAVQVLLGVVTYVTKFGFGSMVVVEGSTGQVLSRTAHMVVGLLLVASASVLTVRSFRVHSIIASKKEDAPATEQV